MKILGGLLAVLLLAQAALADDSKGFEKRPNIIPGVPLVLGPKLSLGVPHPSVGLEVKFADLIGASFDYGFLPDVSVSGVTGGFSSGWHVDGRLYPLRGAFFLGVALGRRTFQGSYVTGFGSLQIEPRSTIDVTYLAPEIGWRWVYQSGLFLGVELGWELVLSYTRNDSDLVNALRATGQLNPDLDSAIDSYGKAGLPHVGFQIGYFF